MLRAMPAESRRQGSLETTLCRKGLWASGPAQLSLPLDSQDLLGLVRASGTLKLTPDLEILVWLTERWRHDRDPDGWVPFTLYELGAAVYGRKPNGNDRQRLRASLRRLVMVSVDITGWDPMTGELAPNVAAAGGRLIDWLRSDLDRLGPDPGAAELGALRGSTFQAQIPRWMRQQVAAGHVTYLDWGTLRALDGLAKRLWVYLQAERFKPTGQGEEETWIKLGDRAYTTLGMNYGHERQARAAIKRAGAAICTVDTRYQSVTVERRPGGWAIVATRLRSRERGAIRAAVRASFDG